MTDDPRDAALRWLPALAEDVLEHECCWGCKANAAQALEALGMLDEVLARLGLQDPRALPWGSPEAAVSAEATAEAGGAYVSSLDIVWDEPQDGVG